MTIRNLFFVFIGFYLCGLGAREVTFDQENLIKRPISTSYSDRENEINKAFKGLTIIQRNSGGKNVKNILIEKNKKLKELIELLQKHFLKYFKEEPASKNVVRKQVIEVNVPEDGKRIQKRMLENALNDTNLALKELAALQTSVAKYSQFKDIYDALDSKFTILNNNIKELQDAFN